MYWVHYCYWISLRTHTHSEYTGTSRATSQSKQNKTHQNKSHYPILFTTKTPYSLSTPHCAVPTSMYPPTLYKQRNPHMWWPAKISVAQSTPPIKWPLYVSSAQSLFPEDTTRRQPPHVKSRPTHIRFGHRKIVHILTLWTRLFSPCQCLRRLMGRDLSMWGLVDWCDLIWYDNDKLRLAVRGYFWFTCTGTEYVLVL